MSATCHVVSSNEGAALADALAAFGEVEVHSNGVSLLLALAKIETPPELIVLGDDGPGLDRLEQLNGIQGLFGSSAPPVLVLVEPEREDLMVKALERGAADVVLRPFRGPDLLARAQARAQPGQPPQPRVLDARLLYDSLARPVTSQGGVLFGLRLIVADLSQSSLTRVLKGVRLAPSGGSPAGELCAIKVLDPEVAAQDEDWAARFAREQSVLLGSSTRTWSRFATRGPSTAWPSSTWTSSRANPSISASAKVPSRHPPRSRSRSRSREASRPCTSAGSCTGTSNPRT